MHRQAVHPDPVPATAQVAGRQRPLLRLAQAIALGSCALGWPAGCATQPAIPVDGVAVSGMPVPQTRMSLLGSQDSIYGPIGRYRVLHSPCRGDERRGRPVVLPDRAAQPTVGVPTHIQWNTELLSPRAPVAAFLLVSFGLRPPIDLTPAGYPGCVMWVDPSPSNLFTLTPTPGSILTLEGGRLHLHWTPGPEFRGQSVIVQPLFAVPPRWLWAPAVEVWVGG